MTDLRLSIAQHLTSIERLCRDLETEALHRFADKEYPGGPALTMLGPVANIEAWNYRQLSELMGRTYNGSGLDDLDSDPAPPLLVVSGWADVIATERGDVRRQRASIKRECAFIRGVLDWVTGSNADGDSYFLAADELDRDLGVLVRRLEAVLHDGIAVDRGVPCMRCGKALVKVWGANADSDRWHCGPCDEWSSGEQYNLAVKAAHRANATKLNATDMLAEYRIKAGTLTGWAAKGIVHKRGKDGSGRILYDVTEALAQRDRDTRPADDEVA
jgi:hypothetical protein